MNSLCVVRCAFTPNKKETILIVYFNVIFNLDMCNMYGVTVAKFQRI